MADFSPDKEGLSPGTYPLLERSGLKTRTAWSGAAADRVLLDGPLLAR